MCAIFKIQNYMFIKMQIELGFESQIPQLFCYPAYHCKRLYSELRYWNLKDTQQGHNFRSAPHYLLVNVGSKHRKYTLFFSPLLFSLILDLEYRTANDVAFQHELWLRWTINVVDFLSENYNVLQILCSAGGRIVVNTTSITTLPQQNMG